MIWLPISIIVLVLGYVWYNESVIKPVDIEQDEIKIDDLINQQ